MHLHHPQICLMAPEIPQNTGNIARLAAASACRLHIVRPTAFSLHDKNVRRAGLDYWPFVDLEIHESFPHLLRRGFHRLAFLSRHAESKSYEQIPADTELIVFGNETSGLPKELWAQYSDHFYHIPMFHEGVRSLNLANAVSIVVYHQLSKRGISR